MGRVVSFSLAGAFCALLLLGVCKSAPPAAPAGALRDFRGIIHCHSLYSHDSKGTYEEILAAAKAAKVDFICMTDHPPKGDPGLSLREGWKGIRDGVLFIQGAEYSDNILALGIRDPIQFKDRRGTIKAIHGQGGVAIVCHPEAIRDWSEFDEADGMEIYNVHAAVMKHKNDLTFAAKVVKEIKEDPEHSFQLLQELDSSILERWDQINLKRRFAGIAGNDSHQNVNFLGAQLDPYPRAFKFVSTHVLAKELTEEAILDAIRKARCYVAFDILGQTSSFAFAGGGCCGGQDWADRLMPYGSDVPPEGGFGEGTAAVWLTHPLGPAPRPPGREGVRLPSAWMEQVFIPVPGVTRAPLVTKGAYVDDVVYERCVAVPPGLYRVVVYQKTGEISYPWILPNPIFVGRRS